MYLQVSNVYCTEFQVEAEHICPRIEEDNVGHPPHFQQHTSLNTFNPASGVLVTPRYQYAQKETFLCPLCPPNH
jgi:hypothetical protein